MSDRYAWLKSFVAEWRPRPLESGDGYGEREIRETEERLEITFPAALREWYLLAGKREDIHSRNDRAIPLSSVFIQAGMLHIWEDEERVNFSGISVSEVSLEDPPVWIMYIPDGLSAPYTSHVPLTQWLNETVAYEVVMGAEYLAMGAEDEEEVAWESLERVREVGSRWTRARFYRGIATLIMRAWVYRFRTSRSIPCGGKREKVNGVSNALKLKRTLCSSCRWDTFIVGTSKEEVDRMAESLCHRYDILEAEY